MHISKLQLVNYRNFHRANIFFNKGINTIIGENGSGKTNLFRAIRLLLDDNMLRSAIKLKDKDFHRGLGDWRGHWIVISLEFDDVSQDESIQSLFLHGTGNLKNGAVSRATYNLIFRPKAAVRLRLAALAEGDHAGLSALLTPLTIDDYETTFTGRSTADFTDPAVYKALVGDFEAVKFPDDLTPPEIGARVPSILSITKEISFTFVQALRDVVADFQNNRTNPLLTLLRSKSGAINPVEFEPITEKVKELNAAIEDLSDVKEIRTDIGKTINDAAGETYSPSSLSIRSDLPDEADRLFQSLKLFIGESEPGYEGAIHDLSLGGANLIYLTLKLLEFKYQKVQASFANFLLIEEPEAHIHTHIQKTLFDKLNYADTQVIYSTHSTHISEVSNVENINVLGRSEVTCEVFQPSTDLTQEQVRNIQRYLDAVRSNLLFAKSVVLVEGDAEEILIPILVKKVLGVSLDELGISLINIRSTGFQNVAILFHDRRIRKRCGILTDLDAAFIDTKADTNDSEATAKAKKKALGAQTVGIARQESLGTFCHGNPWVRPFFAANTFEVDFVAAGNSAKVVAVLNAVYTTAATIAAAKADLESHKIDEFGQRVLIMAASAGKGWFAILLGKTIDAHTIIPMYVLRAILFAHGSVNTAIAHNILNYRLSQITSAGSADAGTIAAVSEKLNQFRENKLAFPEIRTAMLTAFPADEINAILAEFLPAMFVWNPGELNPEQEAAVAEDRSVFLTACPGSGRARTLTYKIARELSQLQSDRQWVIAITYTHRAADEIAGRIEDMGLDSSKLWVGTIHSFCLEWILKPYGIYHPHLKNGFRIINAHDTETRLTAICRPYNNPRITPWDCGHYYTPDGLTMTCYESKREAVAEILAQYREELLARGQIDFELMLSFAYELLTSNPSIGKILASLFSWVLIDEYQDTKEIQYAIVAAILRAGGGTVRTFIVGDANQAIYGTLGGYAITAAEFAGLATIDLKEMKLSRNYRSSRRVVDYFGNYIVLPTQISADAKHRDYGSLISFDDTTPQGQLEGELIRLIRYNIEVLGIAPAEVCVLAPQWVHLASMTRRLVAAMGEYQFDGPGMVPFARDIDNFWYKLSKIVLTEPSPAMYVKRLRWAGDILATLDAAGADISSLSRKLFLRECNSITLAETNGLAYLSEFFDALFLRLGIDFRAISTLKEHHDDFFESSRVRIDRLMRDGTELIAEIGSFRKVFANRSGITVSTIHGVKGTEFDAVIAYALLEGMIPHFSDPGADESAKRLLYVICSRARKNLHLISERGRMRQGAAEYQTTTVLADCVFTYDTVP